MATITESPGAKGHWRRALIFLRRSWNFLWPPADPSLPAVTAPEVELTFVGRIRKFLWLSSGLFSAASFAIPAIGLFAYGTTDGMATDFLAAVVSACLFGVASVLHFGPDEA